jgi:hypothetical protein
MPVNTTSPVLGHRITSVKLIADPNTNALLRSCRIGSHGQDPALPMHYKMYGTARACRRLSNHDRSLLGSKAVLGTGEERQLHVSKRRRTWLLGASSSHR